MSETTIQCILDVYPERIQSLFDALDLNRTGLQDVRTAADRGDMLAACRALLDYYRTGDSGKWLRGPAMQPGDGRDETVEKLLGGIFTDYGGEHPYRLPDGRIDWAEVAIQSDRGWVWDLNRMEYLPGVLAAYRRTGNPRYAEWMDDMLRDWVVSSLPYPAEDTLDARWRGLETAIRVKQWAVIFYALQQDCHLSDATRLLMLTSLPEHAHYLRHFHKNGGNWITTELSGLGLIAAAWPEFRDAAAWQAYSGETLLRSMPAQIYPDGVQKELTSGYHYVALKDFTHYAEICRDAGLPLPAGYREWLEKMWNYLAYSLRPDGCAPQNNDSDLSSYRDRLIQAAEEYGRPDWLYVATNGSEGEEPTEGPALIFPWAGQVIARSGWDADALWAFFDIGPAGMGHAHCDKLHLSVDAHGRALLIDPGRFTYAYESKEGRFQGKYAGLSVAHNVILIDDRGQALGAGTVDSPVSEEDCLITPEMTFARGTCDEFFEEIYSGRLAGRAVHTRAVVCLKNDLIVVADRVETDRPRKLDTLWHWHPRCTVEIDGQIVRSVDPGVGNLRIAPVAGFDWAVETVKGQEPAGIHGTMQGWYAHGYNNWEPSPASVFTAHIEQTSSFAWLLVPARGEVPAIDGEIVESTDDAIAIRIRRGDADPQEVRIPWRAGQPSLA
ncbi:MAG: alginate lyase family protein [Planctomycetota bacterium]|jgi:hypothetical protein